jgi:hypothetical protein
MAEVAENLGRGFAEVAEAEDSDMPVRDAAELVCTSRDPQDVWTIRVVAISALTAVATSLICAVAIVAVIHRKPYVQFIRVNPSGEVVGVDVRKVGETDAPDAAADELGLKMKASVASEFARLLYTVNLRTREQDNARLLNLMIKGTAEDYWRGQKLNGIPQGEVAQQMQATWSEQDKRLDDKDPYVIEIIGQQKVTRVVNDSSTQDTKQYRVQIRLVEDKQGPTPRNLNTGFRVQSFSVKPL